MLVNITKKIVIVFIIGVLVGAIIATAGFLIFSKTCGSRDIKAAPPAFSQNDNGGMPGRNDNNAKGNFGNNGRQNDKLPQMPGGNNGSNAQNQQPPQASGNNSDNNVLPLPGESESSNSN